MHHDFQSGGRTVRVETYPGKANGQWPSVILLHGANGVQFANVVISGIMQHLGANDLAVHLVHYFDRTGTAYADNGTIHRHFGEWLETVQDAIRYIQSKNPGSAVGLFGHSLGGYLTAATLVRNPAVKAGVVLSGGLDEESARNMQRAAPVQIFHGTADTRVSITEARRLEISFKMAGVTPEFHAYPGEGHVLEMSSYADVLDRATRFLGRELSARPQE